MREKGRFIKHREGNVPARSITARSVNVTEEGAGVAKKEIPQSLEACDPRELANARAVINAFAGKRSMDKYNLQANNNALGTIGFLGQEITAKLPDDLPFRVRNPKGLNIQAYADAEKVYELLSKDKKITEAREAGIIDDALFVEIGEKITETKTKAEARLKENQEAWERVHEPQLAALKDKLREEGRLDDVREFIHRIEKTPWGERKVYGAVFNDGGVNHSPSGAVSKGSKVEWNETWWNS